MFLHVACVSVDLILVLAFHHLDSDSIRLLMKLKQWDTAK